jgi:NAD(P)-dependent dehydrogenase (short-subunit alcohol dehydrogenase family)
MTPQKVCNDGLVLSRDGRVHIGIGVGLVGVHRHVMQALRNSRLDMVIITVCSPTRKRRTKAAALSFMAALARPMAARCVVFLAADEAAWITGSTPTINGGQFMD